MNDSHNSGGLCTWDVQPNLDTSEYPTGFLHNYVMKHPESNMEYTVGVKCVLFPIVDELTPGCCYFIRVKGMAERLDLRFYQSKYISDEELPDMLLYTDGKHGVDSDLEKIMGRLCSILPDNMGDLGAMSSEFGNYVDFDSGPLVEEGELPEVLPLGVNYWSLEDVLRGDVPKKLPKPGKIESPTKITDSCRFVRGSYPLE